MIKFVVAFRKPQNLDDFENTYNDFLALVERMPNVQRRQVVHITGSPQGEPVYHRILETYYETDALLRQALMSKEGQEAGNELARFEEGSFDVYFAEVYEEAGGSTPQNDVSD